MPTDSTPLWWQRARRVQAVRTTRSCRFAEDLRHVWRMPPLKATCNGERIRSLFTTRASRLRQSTLETGRHALSTPTCDSAPPCIRPMWIHSPGNRPSALWICQKGAFLLTQRPEVVGMEPVWNAGWGPRGTGSNGGRPTTDCRVWASDKIGVKARGGLSSMTLSCRNAEGWGVEGSLLRN